MKHERYRRRTGAGDVEDAGVRQRVLQPEPGASLLRGPHFAARALRPRRVGHGVRFVEDDHALVGMTRLLILSAGEPGHDLVETGLLPLSTRGQALP